MIEISEKNACVSFIIGNKQIGQLILGCTMSSHDTKEGFVAFAACRKPNALNRFMLKWLLDLHWRDFP